MSEVKRVKIQSFIESQIPEFLNSESPLFKEFLEQYYISQEHQTGVTDLTVNLQNYKSIDNFNNETFYSTVGICTLTSDVVSFDDTILVNHTIGFPQKYGLLKIDNEIITYTGITTNSFTGCIRGFCGLDKDNTNDLFKFSSTDTSDHTKNSQVINLNILFFQELFKKFKTQFLPGFEDRQFATGINLQTILSRAKDFYTTKGTDTSFKILFSVLFNESISVIKPQDYLISPSSNDYLITKNILVEQIIRDSTFKVSDSTLRKELKGKTIFQSTLDNKTASASIYNVEYRPINSGDFIYNSVGFDETAQKNYITKDFYEISLDRTSFILNFESTKKTKVLENTFKNSTSILVDSTIGFKKSGTLLIKPKNLSNPIVLTYTDKTINEFLNVSGLTIDLDYGAEIIEENFLYTYLDDGSKIEFRLINIINDIDYKETSNLRVNDKIQLSSFGIDLNDRIEFNQWIYNVPTTHLIKSVDTGKIYLYENINLSIGDQVVLSNPDLVDVQNVTVSIEEFGFNEFGPFISIKGPNTSTFKKTHLTKIINKVSSDQNYFPNVSIFPSSIQNTYIDYNSENFYVASSGLPNYEIYATDRKTFVSANVSTGSTTILNCSNHNLFTGEKIYYIQKSGNVGIRTSAYFVTKVNDNQVKLSYSNSDLFSKTYVPIKNNVDGDYFVKFDFQNKSLGNQKLFKKFNLVKKLNKFFTDNDKSTIDKATGILINGVEIFSPTLYDENIYYGKINSVIVESSGKDYDVINFSGLEVDDIYGTGASVEANLSGSLDKVILLNPGIGYPRKPKITLVGGNGSGAVLESNLVKTKIVSKFKPSSAISIGSSTIQFLTNHNFDDGEEVSYINDSNGNISPLINNSNYFVGIVSATQLKLYKTKENALGKNSPITFTGIGSGIHSLKTLNSKNTITKIYVKEKGKNYSNRSVKIPSDLSSNNQNNGINTFDDYIFAKEHNFKNEDVVIYSTSGTSISGLSTQTNYYVTVIDSNRFKLSVFGSSENQRINYDNKKYVRFSSVGVGTHIFSYPPIQIEIEHVSGIATSPSAEPIVLGSIENVFITNDGKNYGSPDTLNYHRKPRVGIFSILSECILKPVLLNGSIVDVQILNSGRGYGKDIDIKIFGKGKYAELYPIVTNGKITSINILNSGIGYDEKTTLLIQRRGLGARFSANIFEWKINQVEKNKKIISPNDGGLIVPSKNNETTLEFIHFYPPKNLRFKVNNFIDKDNNEILPDNNQNPYKILGWAYDGNPIFGPYGKVNGESKLLQSSYKLKNSGEIGISISNQLRPNFGSGFFVQDYLYDRGTGDLDEYNGMFINDKNLPNINYGYFSTISNDEKEPQYPYTVPLNFKDLPIEENFNPLFNQDFNFESLDIVRNIGPYYLNSSNSSYDLIDKIDSKYKQEFIVKDISSSGITSISIFEPGDNYKVGELIKFDSKSSGGNSVSAEISRIKGKNVSNVQVGILTFTDVNFITKGVSIKGITNQPHNLISDDEIIISNLSSSEFNHLEGTKKIYVFQNSAGLVENLESQSVTGVTTYVKVTDVSGFEVDNFIGIGTEVLKIINISSTESKLYVNRFDNYSGIHSVGFATVTLLPNTFTFSTQKYEDDIVENKTVYFNPSNTIGIGTTGSIYYNIVGFQTAFGTLNATGLSTVGVNTTLLEIGDYVFGTNIQNNTTITSIGIGSITITPDHTLGGGISTNLLTFSRKIYDKTVPSRSIYIPSHKFYTGQSITYNVGLVGNGIVVSETGTGTTFRLANNQTVYTVNLGKDYVGLSTLGFTTSTGIGTTQNSLYFRSPIENIGLAHSLTTQYEKIKGKVNNYSVVVSTSQTHGLQTGDNIKFNFEQSNTNTIKLRYDKVIRKITTELIDFDPLSGINTLTNEINIPGNNLKTGDKIVYYTNDQTSVGGLSTNAVYYVLKQNPDKIKLSSYQYDANVGIAITLTSVGSGLTHNFALVNPPINILNGNIISFDLTDGSLSNMDLRLYADSNFSKEIETFKYLNYDTNRVKELNTKLSLPTEIYYNLISLSKNEDEKNQLSSDKEVNGFNKIKIIPNNINTYHSIIKTGNSQFKFNLNVIPEPLTFISGLSTSYYDTDSKNVVGPISNLRVNFGGRGYKKIPKISSITTTSGKGAALEAKSSTIGKIENLERVKDGFDYPSDTTLKPFLSVPAVAQIGDISRIEYVGIITGGNGYNTAPTLKVLGNNKIKLSAKLQSGSVIGVDIVENTNDLITPLRIVPIRNSNGYEIDSVVASNDGSTVTLELLNNSELFPLITTGYGTTDVVFPFTEGDEIFIENCRQVDRTKDNINSKDYSYRFFTVTSVSSQNFTVTFSMTGVKDSLNLNQNNGESNYENGFGYGYVVNKKDMAVFEMNLVDDLSYISGENVFGYDNRGNSVFSAKVAENGWDNEINQLRMVDAKGELEVGNKLKGEKSLLNGTVKDVNKFNLKANLGVSRDKVNESKNQSGFLNDYLQRLSDNFYYQRFSYAIKSQISYDKWKEPIKSLIHPSGFKEFSDLDIVSIPSSNVKVGISSNDLNLSVLMDNIQSLYTKNNFTLVLEDDDNLFEDGSIERINVGAEEGNIAGVGTFGPIFGVPLKEYILNKTNKVLLMNDISDQFDGSNDYISIGTTTATFNALNQYYVGISTENLKIGDYIGNSEFLIPEATLVDEIGINSIRINLPHRLQVGIDTTDVSIRRKLPGNKVVGKTSFELTSGISSEKVPLYYREFNSNSSQILNLDNNIINLKSHNFQTGQRVFYNQSIISQTPVGSATTEVDNAFSYNVSNKFDSNTIMRFDMTIFKFDSN
jgi:hypothetical protein